MIKVVSILSHSRSGSTILDLILGQHPAVFSAGEICNIYRYGLLETQYCSCKELVTHCPFWKGIIGKFLEKLPEKKFHLLQENLSRFERHRFVPLMPLFAHSQHYELYEKQILALYQTIAEETASEVIVDSSKNPLRFYWLTKMARKGLLNLFPVFLVRDGRGVIASHKKALQKTPEKGVQMDFRAKSDLKTTLTWLWMNLEIEKVTASFADMREPFILRYEDLCSDLEKALLPLGDSLGITLQETLKAIASGQSFQAQHLLSGNRLRMKEQIIFSPDFSWKKNKTLRDSKSFWSLAGWYARRLGYEK